MTTSTAICVSARSGAENHANVSAVTSPAPPVMIKAARRWYLPWFAAPIAQAAPTTQSSAKTGLSGVSGWSPACQPAPRSGTAAAKIATSTISSSCDCRRREPSTRARRSLTRTSVTMTMSKARRPSIGARISGSPVARSWRL